MKKIIFVSNVIDNSKLNILNLCFYDVDLIFTNDFTNIITNNDIVITENITIESKYGEVTSENILEIMKKFKGVKLTNDVRDVYIKYEYKLYFNEKESFKINKCHKGVLSNKKLGKSSVFYENYIMNIPEWKMISQLDQKEKDRMINLFESIKQLSAHYICHIFNIDINNLYNYTENNLVKKSKSDYNISKKYSISYQKNQLSVCVDEYFETRGWGDWLFSGREIFNINIDTINFEMSEYIETTLQKEKEALEEREKEREIEREREREIEKERQENLERQKSNRSHSKSSYSSNFNEAEYDRRGREGNGWSSQIDGFTNDEVDSYNDRAYERNHDGRSRYDM